MSAPLSAAELPGWVLSAFDRICGESPVALAVVDLTREATAVVLANPEMEKLFGAPLAGRTLAEFSDPDELLDDVPVRARVVEGMSNVYERAKRYRRADGTMLDLHVFGALLGRVRDRQIGFGVFTPATDWVRRGYRTQSLLAMALARGLQSLLFDVQPSDPSTFALVGALVFVAALVSSYLPGRDAALTAPATALRQE